MPDPDHRSLLKIEEFLARTHQRFCNINTIDIENGDVDLEEVVNQVIANGVSEDLPVEFPSPMLLDPLLRNLNADEVEETMQAIGFFILLKIGSYINQYDYRRASLLRNKCSSWGLLNLTTREQIDKHAVSQISKQIERGELDEKKRATARFYGLYN